MCFTGPILAFPCTSSVIQDDKPVRIGIYDSRIIAVAFTRTEDFNKNMETLNADLEAAKASGDRVTVICLERSMTRSQEILQKQVFSTYPVTAILDKVRDKLPEIALQADVSCIVNKWEADFFHEGVEIVDVTVQIASLFADKEEITMMYPASGIPSPEELAKMEGLTSGSGIEEVYENGPECTVVKKELQGAESHPKMVGRWKASEWYVHGANLLGEREFYFNFNPDGTTKVEEPGGWMSEGEWIIGLSENTLLLELKDSKSSFTGRYDIIEDQLILSGKGLIGSGEYVCIKLEKAVLE